MLTRIWHGRTSPENADAYEELLRTEVLPGIAHRYIDGYRGALLLRRELEDGPEFVTVLQFDSQESVRAFAGDDAERAVVPPKARELLERFDERAAHYETVALPAAPSEGWFVVNVRDAEWFSNDALGAGCVFEGDGDARFAELGFRVRVLWPGQPNANYHSEYPVSELARRHGAGVDEETTDPAAAYARFPAWEQRRPAGWTGLPWGRE